MAMGTGSSWALRVMEAMAATAWAFSWATMVLMTGYSSSASWKSTARPTFSLRISSERA